MTRAIVRDSARPPRGAGDSLVAEASQEGGAPDDEAIATAQATPGAGGVIAHADGRAARMVPLTSYALGRRHGWSRDDRAAF
jgi:hypothetical protein